MHHLKFWLKISLLNLCIVAFLGVLMRYKIGFEFPYFEQKNLQHSHYNFAFSGWISHTLITLMVHYLQTKIASFNGKTYKAILIANLICSYGLLISFIIPKSDLFSIIFSTLSIFVSYVFCYQYIKDLKQLDNDYLAKKWFKAALLFNVLSSFGSFYLAYMMISKNIIQDVYLSSVYFYLHFQYNGWFFFACMGLFYGFLNLRKSDHPFFETFFTLFTVACIPAYFLSTLWLDLPLWLYIITTLAAFIQLIIWFKFLSVLTKTREGFLENYPLRYILVFVGLALSIKLALQLGSTLPTVSQLAFGFRPIVIAYLHLVLLAVISLFLLFYIYTSHLILITKKIKFGLILFSTGVLLNEIILAIQGIASFSYTPIPYANELLFITALILFLGIGITTYYSLKKVAVV
ncbi:hypothetical protein FNW52_02215 [Flavobacterium sp. ZT3R18]|uniref:hypothetical protein n=1 Tax=Flavobacterium sp. ZT3R18 TaxID=2594429 RepID=UPI00117A810E|nr:hypothetical protein [Flavobacterium sp. ZT3R18]TRX38880.1 hypothetical protein FNW52_02215 [Flavobacterium sp. ZT3R18]